MKQTNKQYQKEENNRKKINHVIKQEFCIRKKEKKK